MCRSTAGPLLAIVGVAGTAAGIAIAIVRERVDRLADARAAKQAAEAQDAPDGARQDSDEDNTGVSDSEPVESEPDASK